MKKFIIAASVVAGTALGAVACTSSSSPPQGHPDKITDQIVAQWAHVTGLPVTRALQQETNSLNPMAINDAQLALSEDNAPSQLETTYVGTVEAYLTLAYDENDPTLTYRVNADAATAHSDYETFLLTLNQFGMNLSG